MVTRRWRERAALSSTFDDGGLERHPESMIHVRTNVLTSFNSTDMLSYRDLLCDSYGMRTRTAKMFASTMFALKQPFSFSTIPTRLRNVMSLLRMNVG